MYCSGSGNAVPTGECDAGWYCDGGDDNATPTGKECTVGKIQFYNLVYDIISFLYCIYE